MNKCEWKGSDFKTCNEMSKIFRGKLGTEEPKMMVLPPYGKIDYCPWCGADIRKPKPEVIIKKSGKTWVLNESKYGDWIVLKPEMFETENKILEYFNEILDNKRGNPAIFGTIDKIEITDEIALLRPMIISLDGEVELLLAVTDGVILTPYTAELVRFEQWKIATVSDLKNHGKPI